MEDESNQVFGNTDNVSSAFWETYMKGRPKVPSSIFTRIYDYHSSNGGKFDVAHDVGAGGGHLSMELAKRFKKVIVTEPNSQSLESAKKLLNSRGPSETEYQFMNGRIEDVELEPRSVDLVFAAVMMHWTDVDPALDAVAKQLKHGGTFFAGLWGLPVLLDEKADDVWGRIMNTIAIKGGNASSPEQRNKVFEMQDSGYDSMALSDELFRPDALRVKLNVHNDDALRMCRAQKDKTPLVSRVGASERVIFEDDQEWFFEKDLAGLKDTAGSFPADPGPEIMEPLWQEMESVLRDGKCKGYFPASLVLATRK